MNISLLLSQDSKECISIYKHFVPNGTQKPASLQRSIERR